ncbi:MAG: hypothetical protein ACU0BK_01785 [Shimia sp.]
MTGSSEPNYVPSRRREWLSFAFLTGSMSAADVRLASNFVFV